MRGLQAHTLAYTNNLNTHVYDGRKWSGQVKQMQSLWPEWESDVLKCAPLFSLPFFYQFISPPSVSSDVFLCRGHPRLPKRYPASLLFPPHYSLFFHICISLSSLSFNVFFSLFCVCSSFSLNPVWDLCWDQPAGNLAVVTAGSLQRGDDPWTLRLWPFSFSLLSAPALSLHTASLLFISEHQFQQGSSTARTWQGYSELGMCVEQKKKSKRNRYDGSKKHRIE